MSLKPCKRCGHLWPQQLDTCRLCAPKKKPRKNFEERNREYLSNPFWDAQKLNPETEKGQNAELVLDSFPEGARRIPKNPSITPTQCAYEVHAAMLRELEGKVGTPAERDAATRANQRVPGASKCEICGYILFTPLFEEIPHKGGIVRRKRGEEEPTVNVSARDKTALSSGRHSLTAKQREMRKAAPPEPPAPPTPEEEETWEEDMETRIALLRDEWLEEQRWQKQEAAPAYAYCVPRSGLTADELAVMQGKLAGKSIRELARDLGFSPAWIQKLKSEADLKILPFGKSLRGKELPLPLEALRKKRRSRDLFRAGALRALGG